VFTKAEEGGLTCDKAASGTKVVRDARRLPLLRPAAAAGPGSPGPGPPAGGWLGELARDVSTDVRGLL
jgi:hypothetical protein